MFRFLLLLVAGFVALSVYAPDTAQDLLRRSRDAFVAFQQGAEPAPVQPDPKDNDAGGFVRIRSDRAGHYVSMSISTAAAFARLSIPARR